MHSFFGHNIVEKVKLITFEGEQEKSYHGPVITSPEDPLYLGSTSATNNTGELSAIGMALHWLIEADVAI